MFLFQIVSFFLTKKSENFDKILIIIFSTLSDDYTTYVYGQTWGRFRKMTILLMCFSLSDRNDGENGKQHTRRQEDNMKHRIPHS